MSAILIFIFSAVVVRASTQKVINDRPIIGIVTVDSLPSQNYSSYLYASYVKQIESAGGRVVPIWIHQPVEYYRNLLNQINGVLFPGGGVDLRKSGYGMTAKIIFDIANQMNERGDYFPLWGTCLGFELLIYLVAKKNLLKACDAEDLAKNLTFTKGFKESRMFGEVEETLEKVMRDQETVIHYHQFCITPQNFSASRLDQYFKVLALNQDWRNTTFVSIIEARNYPYYGVAFHPEKVLFEWPTVLTHKNIPKSLEAMTVSQYFGNFFVNEARRNGHRFYSTVKEDSALIYNYNPVFSGKNHKDPTVQKYLFK